MIHNNQFDCKKEKLSQKIKSTVNIVIKLLLQNSFNYIRVEFWEDNLYWLLNLNIVVQNEIQLK